ncbi:MAG: hypothetical protein ACRD6W_06520 [Nitrososphaerales archaeon]
MTDSKRTDYATQNDVHPDYHGPEAQDSPMPVPVKIVHTVKTELKASRFGVYTTFIIPPGSSNAVMVLPEDPDRARAVITTRTTIAVLCNTQSAAQAPGNIAATTGGVPPTPAGFLTPPSAPFVVENESALWAVNSDPNNDVVLSLVIERNNPC